METKTIIENGVLKKVPFDYKPAKAVTKRLTKDELEELALETISKALQSVDAAIDPETASRIAHSALDRLKGKPGQAITVDQTLRHITVNANIQFIQPNTERLLQTPVDNAQVIEHKE